MDNRPIGVLDSGLGGLTVLKKVIEKMPNESTIFIGDQANMPYGDRSREEIISLTRDSVNFLLSKDVKIIIFGCFFVCFRFLLNILFIYISNVSTITGFTSRTPYFILPLLLL